MLYAHQMLRCALRSCPDLWFGLSSSPVLQASGLVIGVDRGAAGLVTGSVKTEVLGRLLVSRRVLSIDLSYSSELVLPTAASLSDLCVTQLTCGTASTPRSRRWTVSLLLGVTDVFWRVVHSITISSERRIAPALSLAPAQTAVVVVGCTIVGPAHRVVSSRFC
jgi:hypothetical protein